jgi:hypothetical protein
MTEARFKIKARHAEEICVLFKPSDHATSLLKREHDPQRYMLALFDAGAHDDLIWYLSLGLPQREAVWWSCVCARAAPVEEGSRQAVDAAIEAAETWVRKPSEDARRAAEKASLDAPEMHASRWSASAAFWSGGSIAPLGAPEAAAPEGLTGKAVASAVLLSAAADPEHMAALKARFSQAGMDIARGGNGVSGAAPNI